MWNYFLFWLMKSLAELVTIVGTAVFIIVAVFVCIEIVEWRRNRRYRNR